MSSPMLENKMAGEKPKQQMNSELPQKSPIAEAEVKKKKLKYPLAVLFILGAEFCERFSFYGMRAVLVLYFRQILLYSESAATQAFHVFVMGVYFTPIFGAIIADIFLGRFKSIFYIGLLYAAGQYLLAYSSYLEQAFLSIIALAIIALGTGGIKPNTSAFGGDQFLPGQEAQLSTFFSALYFIINSGSFISTIVTPIFRQDIHCSKSGQGCFPLAFGVPALLMSVAVLLFLIGRPFYRVLPPAKGNILLKFLGCTFRALFRKLLALLTCRSNKKSHWLYYADDKYEVKLIEDARAALKVMFMYLPMPVFWALFDQQGSRWTLQATRLNGNIFGVYRIKPDQMQMVNAGFIIIMIPFFVYVVYPICKKIGILSTSLQRMAIGGFLAALAFVFAAMLDFTLEGYLPVLPGKGESELTVVNGIPCPLSVQLGRLTNETFTIASMGVHPIRVASETDQSLEFSTTYSTNCLNDTKPFHGLKRTSVNISPHDRATNSIYVTIDVNDTLHASISPFQKVKPLEGVSVTLFYDISRGNIIKDVETNVTLLHVGQAKTLKNVTLPKTVTGVSKTQELIPRYTKVTYEAYLPFLGNRSIGRFSTDIGAGYFVVILLSNTSVEGAKLKSYAVIPPNEVHMLWQLIQYTTITAGEIMFSITGLEFSYAEAPLSMKSVLQAARLLTNAFGNLLVVLITKFVKLEKQAYAYLLFSGLMTLDMLLFALMARFYVYGIKANAEVKAAEAPKASSKEQTAAAPIQAEHISARPLEDEEQL